MFTISKILPCRRNVNDMTNAERTAFTDAVLQLKDDGVYDGYVLGHQEAMDVGTPSGTDPRDRNAAHRGPAFLPWHREFLIRLENDLRTVDGSVAIPYWDWASDSGLADPASGEVWSASLMGGDGDPADGDIVKTGPFRQGEWEVINDSGGSAGPLIRQFARSGDALATGWTSLPTQGQVNTVMNATPYDDSPWHRDSDPSFRNELEGWIGEGLHNRVHVWVGGDMLPGTSPNDPVFFLHHCFVDKIWADWQSDHLTEDYEPQSGGPTGHNVGDGMFPWPTTPADVLEHQDFYLYDTDEPTVALNPATDLTFLDTPEGETTYRAAVFDVTTCSSLTVEVINGGPPPPFGVLQPAVFVDPGRQAVKGEARLWIGYTGTNDGDNASGTVTIRCDETGEEWDLSISANTVARPTAAVVLALDRSGSMDSPSGVAEYKRIDVLRYSAAPFVELIQEGNGLGIVRFDHDAHTTMGVTGPLGPPGAFDTDRPTARGHIATHSTNLAGNTAIGDALERAHNLLDPETDYQVKATVVFTDGHETASKRISEVTDLINERVYAIGVGTAEQIQPDALFDLTNGTDGYVYLTGELNDDLYFRLTKYFLQVLAGITNEDIVVDPQGWLLPGEKRVIPFDISETDITADAILLSPAPWAFRYWLETPDGVQVDPSMAPGLLALEHVLGVHSAYYRMSLPLPVGATGAREGRWKAILEIDKEHHKKYLSSLDGQNEEMERVKAHGIRYSVNVHSYSNLRMKARLNQSGLVPGSTLLLRAVMTEYGLPMTARADLRAEVTRPDGTGTIAALAEIEPGIFETDFVASIAGVYTARVIADGRTLRGRKFTREQTLTGAVWQGGDRPRDPGIGGGDGSGDGGKDPGDMCRLLLCLLEQPEFLKYLKQRELPVDAIRACIERICMKKRDASSEVGKFLASRPELRQALSVMQSFLKEVED